MEAGKLPRSLKSRWHNEPANFWHGALFASFWLTVALFPIGYGWREVMPPLSFIFLFLYYRHAWERSVLRRLGVSCLFAPAGLMIIIGVVFSGNPWNSFLHSATGLNKAFILPFIAMECVRNERDLLCLVWAFVFACFWEGIDGIWQAATGLDFIMAYPLNAMRLTGSLGDYTVGNYIALTLVPAFAIWPLLRKNFGMLSASFLFVAIFWPALFLLQGASARSGVLAVAGALGLWFFMRYGKLNWRVILMPVLVLCLFGLFQPQRLMPQSITGDNRWDLWGLAWRVFLEHPWFGAGAGQYNAAFRALGLAPQNELITISHPHDLYLDILYAHGIIGFILGMIFLAGFLFWGWRKIMPRFVAEYQEKDSSIYWRMTVWFWLGYAAWLINGIFGHDFYRSWWLAQAMCSLGIMIGAIANGPGNGADAASVLTERKNG